MLHNATKRYFIVIVLGAKEPVSRGVMLGELCPNSRKMAFAFAFVLLMCVLWEFSRLTNFYPQTSRPSIPPCVSNDRTANTIGQLMSSLSCVTTNVCNIKTCKCLHLLVNNDDWIPPTCPVEKSYWFCHDRIIYRRVKMDYIKITQWMLLFICEISAVFRTLNKNAVDVFNISCPFRVLFLFTLKTTGSTASVTQGSRSTPRDVTHS